MAKDRADPLRSRDARRDNPVTEFPGESEDFRAIASNVERDRVLEVNKTAVAVKVANFARKGVATVRSLAGLEEIAY